MSNTSESRSWAAAATLMTLSVSMRCSRDFRYYRSDSPEWATRKELITICRHLQTDSYSLHNHLIRFDTEDAFGTKPEMGLVTTQTVHFLLGRSVHDGLETLHRELLFYNPDHLTGIIPKIDDERRFWNEYNETGFYNQHLINRLENEIPVLFRNFEKSIDTI